jgi:hypothetical protein
MLLFFILFMFFILHIQFLLRNVFLGTYDTTYFQFTSVYLFNHDVAVISLLFSIATACSFGASYTWTYRRPSSQPASAITDDVVMQANLASMRTIFIAFGLMQAIANVILAVTSDFNYQTMAETLESSGFIFELRIFLLVALAFIALNVRPAVFWRGEKYRMVRLVLILYGASILIVQARSRVFEFAAILVYAYLMWAGDRVRWRYLGAIALALLVPNLIVLGRLGIPDDPAVLIDGLFSFEYSITLNNFLGAAIERTYVVQDGLTFLKSLWLLIPSPIRTAMDIDVVKSDAYEALAAIAQVRNGGYSMLAEMYQNFGWFALLAFVAMGGGMGALNRRAARVGNVPIIAATAPLIYAAFVVAFRNDFGVFLKFVIQAFVVAYLLRTMLRTSVPSTPPEAMPIVPSPPTDIDARV